MGSDLSYADMSFRNIDNYHYRLIGEDQINGKDVWLIEAEPKTKDEIDETGYEKSLHYVEKDNFLIIRSINKMKKGGRVKFIEVLKSEKIGDIWVQKEVVVTTKKSDTVLHKTIMKTDNIRFDNNLSDDIFTVRKLESGL
jgi:hypothetical protein